MNLKGHPFDFSLSCLTAKPDETCDKPGTLFERGVYCSHNKINGFQTMVLESYQKTNELIEYFKDAVDKGYDPNSVINQILEECNVKESDLTDFDIQRLNREIEQYVRRKNPRDFIF